MVDLAKHSAGEPVSLAEIAERQEIRCPISSSSSPSCARARWSRACAAGGGYLLAYTAAEPRISDIILVVDEPIPRDALHAGAPVGCRGNKSRCLTHDLWEELGKPIHLYLSSVSLADVVDRACSAPAGSSTARASGIRRRRGQ